MSDTSDLNISERLLAAGYTHRKTPNAENTGRHYVTSIATGECIGEWTAFQALDFLESIDIAQSPAFNVAGLSLIGYPVAEH